LYILTVLWAIALPEESLIDPFTMIVPANSCDCRRSAKAIKMMRTVFFIKSMLAVILDTGLFVIAA
jgi:hypothetical protein